MGPNDDYKESTVSEQVKHESCMHSAVANVIKQEVCGDYESSNNQIRRRKNKNIHAEDAFFCKKYGVSKYRSLKIRKKINEEEKNIDERSQIPNEMKKEVSGDYRASNS